MPSPVTNQTYPLNPTVFRFARGKGKLFTKMLVLPEKGKMKEKALEEGLQNVWGEERCAL